MARRVRGDPDIRPYDGSPEQDEVKRKWFEREEAHRRSVAKALEVANFESLGVDRHASSPTRRLAEVSADTMADPETVAERLNAEGSYRDEPWNYVSVSSVIGMLWPEAGYSDWSKQHGMYPGYLGGLRDRMVSAELASHGLRIGARRHQERCTRCGAQWPTGWPLHERQPTFPDEPVTGCPDCGSPGRSSGSPAREHSVIDLHWMLYRFAPADPGPCPVCGAQRKLANGAFAEWAVIRQLDWACSEADPTARVHPTPFDRKGQKADAAEHYRAAVEPAVWESEAAHYAYWMAVDLLRVAAAGGEETELPDGAVYDPLDGSGQRWIYRPTGWELLPSERGSG